MAKTTSGSRIAPRSKLVRRQVVRRLRLGKPDNWAIKSVEEKNQRNRKRKREKKRKKKKNEENVVVADSVESAVALDLL